MSWRAIQDNVGRSVSLASVSDLAERLYWRMLACSDPWGRLDGHPAKLRALCFPLLNINDLQAGHALIELERVNRILVYMDAVGSSHILIVDFDANQPAEAKRRRGPSRHPDPPKHPTAGLLHSLWITPANQHNSGSTPDDSGSAPDNSCREERRTTLSPLESESGADSTATPQQAASPRSNGRRPADQTPAYPTAEHHKHYRPDRARQYAANVGAALTPTELEHDLTREFAGIPPQEAHRLAHQHARQPEPEPPNGQPSDPRTKKRRAEPQLQPAAASGARDPNPEGDPA